MSAIGIGPKTGTTAGRFRARRYESADGRAYVCGHGDMSPSEIVSSVLLALAGVGGLIFTPQVWAGYLSRRETRFRQWVRSHGKLGYTRWPVGEVTRRGVLRGYVPVTLAVWGIIVAYWVKALSSQMPDDLPPTSRPIAWVALAWFILWLLVLLTVMLFNQPKFIVPPSHRDDAGAVGEWRSSGSRRAAIPPVADPVPSST
jgi:hypothetical protein